MARTVGLGIQDFAKILSNDLFYIDKTDFIKDWWENNDDVTLITRPRRFGKTLTLSMVERFFSNRYSDQEALFGKLSIWQDEKMRALAGQFPVISLSFAGIKENTFAKTKEQIFQALYELYSRHQDLLGSEKLSERDKNAFNQIQMDMTDATASGAIRTLSTLLEKEYGKKVILLLDEYDTPMQEAWVGGYWEELVGFTRNLFNAAFKTNPALDRALMTGITRVSRESLFSDLNNLKVVTTTSARYQTAFGFTEEEVFAAMDEFGMDDREGVKTWYDGFIFGSAKDIYNPWSILNYLQEERLAPYWANTSSNRLAGRLIQEGSPALKEDFEDLLAGGTVTARIREEVVFSELTRNSDSIFSLLLASGYLKPLKTDGKRFTLALTNYEVTQMFEDMVSGWFTQEDTGYNDFIKALLAGDLKWMNRFMNQVALQSFSFFDTGAKPSQTDPERFYHGFVLGLMVDLKDRYLITSNRESGFGRYDVILEPFMNDGAFPGADPIIIEFKVHDPDDEKTLQDTVAAALQQIEDKQYAAGLIARGFAEDRIHKYGFAFEGKTVLIGEG